MSMDRRSFLKRFGGACAGLLASAVGLGSAQEALGQPRGGQHWRRPGKQPDFQRNRPRPRQAPRGRRDTHQAPGMGGGGPSVERNNEPAQINGDIGMPRQFSAAPSQPTPAPEPQSSSRIQPPSTRGRMLSAIASTPTGLAMLQDMGLPAVGQAVNLPDALGDSYSTDLQAVRGDEALAEAYAQGIELTPEVCDYATHPTLQYDEVDAPIEYFSQMGYHTYVNWGTCSMYTDLDPGNPFIWFEIDTPGAEDEYLTYAIEIAIRMFPTGLEMKLNGEDLDWYEAQSPESGFQTHMALASLPGSGSGRHVLELYLDDLHWLVNWHWLTMCAV